MKILRPSAGVIVRGSGAYVPALRVSNADLVAMGAPLSEDEIERLTGIGSRHWVSDEEATSDLATHACRAALERAQVAPDAVERLIVGTVSPDYPSPATACLVERALGLDHPPAYDLTASCSSFLFALDAGVRAVLSGDDNVLVCAADVRSRFVDLADRATVALFGDGAGAVLLGRGPVGKGIVAIGLATDGAGRHAVFVPAGGSREPASVQSVAARRHFIRMEQGPQVYFTAVEGMLRAAQTLLDAERLTFADIDLIVPHQPNRRILDRLAKLGGVPIEKLLINIDRYGNMAGASAAVALHEALTERQLGPGARVLIVTAGAGYTAGAALLVL